MFCRLCVTAIVHSQSDHVVVWKHLTNQLLLKIIIADCQHAYVLYVYSFLCRNNASELLGTITLCGSALNRFDFKLYLCDTPFSITRRAYIGGDLIWMDPFLQRQLPFGIEICDLNSADELLLIWGDSSLPFSSIWFLPLSLTYNKGR